MTDSLRHGLLGSSRSGGKELHGQRIRVEGCQTSGVTRLRFRQRVERNTLGKPIGPIRENTDRSGAQGSQRTGLPVRRRDRVAASVPEREEPDSKRVRVVGEKHPCAFGFGDDPISQARHVPLKLVPVDHLVRPGGTIPAPGNLEERVARFQKEMAEGAHPIRLSTTKAVRVRTDSKTC